MHLLLAIAMRDVCFSQDVGACKNLEERDA